MNRCLLVIDYTNDFVADDGALTCGKPGQDIEPDLRSFVKKWVEDNEPVVFAVDLHHQDDQYHPEHKLFPPHNVEGTDGRKLYGSLQEYYEENQALDHVRWMDKTRYSAFAGTDLDLYLKERGINELHLTGVCTDICVLHTAMDAYNLGYSIVIDERAVASFNEAGHKWALGHFENVLGAKVTKNNERAEKA
ncbi:Nicotinamidase-related amidase [Thalassobacillus cyri]|uniref:Nicotinamidase-related amidase n=1 Tax=Thalassobacillus cyri TaxID=571932 RepID=A0A1H3W3Y5_9BACI|nr:isochorismatase family cysteine hydrolase [Thalassobacillus cyri]SDZ81062.1 Nicotinamidase-related amidase [Thalassobacillus cyri]